MLQTRVCAFLQNTTCNHSRREPLTILHLPPHLRYRIYSESAELPSRVLVHLRVFKGTPLFYFADEVENPTAYSALRLVSRAVNTDVPRCLASLHPILLCGPEITDPRLLKVLLAKPWDLLGHVRSLTIVCNGFEHFSSVYCSWYSHVISGSTVGESLGESLLIPCTCTRTWTTKHVSVFMPTWKAVVSRLAQSSHVAQLELNLVCDVEDSETANMILDLLRPPFQILKCAIRLHPQSSKDLEEIARQTVLRVTGYYQQEANQPPFRYLDLPTELRERVLEFTGLITPHREVQRYAQGVYHLQDSYRRKTQPCACGDFCKNSGAVFPDCFCFRSPFPLFLVCKTMLQDARAVFYRSNRLVILTSPSDNHIYSTNDLLKSVSDAALFFKTLTPFSLSLLRDLEIVLPGFHTYANPYPSISEAIHRIWIPALQHAKNLTLTLYLSYEIYPDVEHQHTSDLQTSTRQLFDVHEELVRPLREVKGLDRFFVYATSPFDDYDWWGQTKVDAINQLQKTAKEHQAKLEGIVMGDEYSSTAKGKMDRRVSMWMSEKYLYA